MERVQRQSEATRDFAKEQASQIAVVRERLKWMWWVQAGQLAMQAYIAKLLIEYQVGKL